MAALSDERKEKFCRIMAENPHMLSNAACVMAGYGGRHAKQTSVRILKQAIDLMEEPIVRSRIIEIEEDNLKKAREARNGRT